MGTVTGSYGPHCTEALGLGVRIGYLLFIYTTFCRKRCKHNFKSHYYIVFSLEKQPLLLYFVSFLYKKIKMNIL